MLLFLVLSLLSPMSSRADSVYDYMNNANNLKGAKASYQAAAAGDAYRLKIIAAAEEECGGRYEGTETAITELAHELFSDKTILRTPNPKNYSVRYDGETKATWLVVETIKCSMHGGHYRSVLSARIVAGTETMQMTWKYVNDAQVGKAAVTNIKRAYTQGAFQLEAEYRTPYGTKISP